MFLPALARTEERSCIIPSDAVLLRASRNCSGISGRAKREALETEMWSFQPNCGAPKSFFEYFSARNRLNQAVGCTYKLYSPSSVT